MELALWLASAGAWSDRERSEVSSVIARFIAKLLPSGNLKHRFEDVDEINRLPIAEAGVSDDGTPFIRLENGPIFYGYRPARIHKLVYYLLASPSLRKQVPVAAYKVAWDILHRYWQGGQCNQQAHYALKPGDTVVEAGAFMGYYTLKAAQDVGPSGHVICIEPVEDNRALITKNLRANDVQNVIVVPCAVSNKKTTAAFYVQNWQKNSLSPDVCKGDTREIRVEVNTIDDLSGVQESLRYLACDHGPGVIRVSPQARIRSRILRTPTMPRINLDPRKPQEPVQQISGLTHPDPLTGQPMEVQVGPCKEGQRLRALPFFYAQHRSQIDGRATDQIDKTRSQKAAVPRKGSQQRTVESVSLAISAVVKCLGPRQRGDASVQHRKHQCSSLALLAYTTA